MTSSDQVAANYPGSPFVGREAELASLRDALASALDGHGRIVLVTGEPGIGKTRTSEEILTEARDRDAEILWGRCQDWEGAPAYWPWLQILRRYVDRTDEAVFREDLTGIADDLAQIMPELQQIADEKPSGATPSPEQRRFQLFDAMARLLRAIAQRQPLVLVLDDVHWADQPSLRLLEFIAQDVHELPLLLIATYRNVELDRQHPLTSTLAELSRDPASRRIILHGLGRDAIAHYIELTSDTKPPSGLVEAVLDETEGNPFFMTEVVGWLLREGGFEDGAANGSWTLHVPESVREAVGNRLDRLGSEVGDVLTTASVIGCKIDLPLLAQTLDVDAFNLLDQLDVAIAAGIIAKLDQPGLYGFRHALIQETIFSGMTTSERLRLHVAIAEALETIHANDLSPYYAELAYHYSEAALVGSAEKAIEYAIKSADQSMERTAWESGAAHYKLALDLLEQSTEPDSPERRCDLRLQAGNSPVESGTTPADNHGFDLTPRELEVLSHLARGNTDREVADNLSISHRTVQVHVSNILGKLGVTSRTAAVAMAIREDLV